MTAIIILNWNGADDTIFCLDSFSSVTGNFFIVVTDNGSNDDSIDRIRKYIDKSPLKIYLQELKSNYGFAKGNNMAISFALKFCPDNFLLLNNDTEVTPSFLKNLIDFSTDNSNYRVLTPQIRLYNSKDKIWNCGGNIIFGMRYYYFANKKIDHIPKAKKFLNISFVTGCALFFYSDVLGNDGKLFSERFFFGEEDFEFSLRMKREKVDMACVLDSVIYHKVGSAAGSGVILDEYSKKNDSIKVISQKNKGLSAARNAGIKAAEGDYVFFLDSDDWIEKDTLKILSESISNEDVICFNGRRYFESGTEEEPDKGIVEEGLAGWDYYNKYALVPSKFHFVCVVLRLYKREFLLNNNLFFEEGIYHEDNLFTPIACYYASKVKVIPDILYVYRIRGGSITQTQNPQRIFDIVTVANKLSSFFIPLNSIDKRTIYREIAGEYFKGFMAEERKIYGKNDLELIRRINWKHFKEVSVYRRHKRIYKLLIINPVLFRVYLSLEKRFKNLLNNNGI